jgi:AraC-like DNA-binding protein
MDERVEAVQRMQDYIAVNLDTNITMADLANVSQYSTWYSYRLFVDLLHMTPAVYIRRLRLSKSALRLRDEKVKIIDVAYDTGYESVDGYQRAFYKEFGCNPYEYSMRPTPIYLFKPYGIKYAQKKENIEMSEVKSVFLQVVEKPERKVIIKRGTKTKAGVGTYLYATKTGWENRHVKPREVLPQNEMHWHGNGNSCKNLQEAWT